MGKLKAIVRKHQERLIIFIQIILCAVFAGKVIDKEIKQKLKFSENNARKEAKRNEKLKKYIMKDAKRIARAEYKIKMAKLKGKAKLNKEAGKLALKKVKDKLKKEKNRNKKHR